MTFFSYNFYLQLTNPFFKQIHLNFYSFSAILIQYLLIIYLNNYYGSIFNFPDSNSSSFWTILHTGATVFLFKFRFGQIMCLWIHAQISGSMDFQIPKVKVLANQCFLSHLHHMLYAWHPHLTYSKLLCRYNRTYEHLNQAINSLKNYILYTYSFPNTNHIM